MKLSRFSWKKGDIQIKIPVKKPVVVDKKSSKSREDSK